MIKIGKKGEGLMGWVNGYKKRKLTKRRSRRKILRAEQKQK